MNLTITISERERHMLSRFVVFTTMNIIAFTTAAVVTL